MSQQQDSYSPESEQLAQGRLQLIDTLKAPIIQMGIDLGYEVVENHDLGAAPVHAAWVFKPGSKSLPDMRLGFICLTELFVVPTETMTKQVKDAIESMPDRQYIAVEKICYCAYTFDPCIKTGH